jgi:alanine-glyoxylate transaminase/serine-glyoxylate transaminase/serine-pyruvate transaminase
MAKNSSRTVGRHFLHIPGPSPLPDRILRAMDTPIIDHRGPEFSRLAKKCLDGIKTIFKTTNPVIIYTATGTGAWEAALVNTLSPGDKVLMVETGQFAALWKKMAEKLGLVPEFITTDWRIGADPAAIEARLREDKKKEIKAVCFLHNETSTGCLSPVAEIRKAIDKAGHPALLMVDTISSLASADYRHDEWGVDVSVGGAQKGLMLPPGMSFNAVSDKALMANKTSTLTKSFWAWDEMIAMNKVGFFPYTPATQMLQGLAVGIEMLHEEGLDNVFARHDRLAEATRRAIKAWGLEIICRDPKYYSPTITAVLLPEGHDAEAFRALALEQFNISYGASFGRFTGKMFRIGHLGDINDACCWAGWPRPKWRSRLPIFRTRRAACRRRWIILSPRTAPPPSRPRSKSVALPARPRESGDPETRVVCLDSRLRGNERMWLTPCSGLPTPAPQSPKSP